MGNWASQAQAALKLASLWRPLGVRSISRLLAVRVSLALISFVVSQPTSSDTGFCMVKFRNWLNAMAILIPTSCHHPVNNAAS
jgi:hypothetical protein